MNRQTTLTLVLVAGLLGMTASTLAWRPAAETRLAATPTTIGVVNLEALMAGLGEVRQRSAQLQSGASRAQEELNTLNTEMNALKTDLETMELSDEDRRQKTRRFLELQALGNAKKELLQALLDQDQGRMLREMYMKITEASGRFAERNGYDMILLDDRPIPVPTADRASTREIQTAMQNKRVLFANNQVDVTDELITLMNNEFNAG